MPSPETRVQPLLDPMELTCAQIGGFARFDLA